MEVTDLDTNMHNIFKSQFNNILSITKTSQKTIYYITIFITSKILIFHVQS